MGRFGGGGGHSGGSHGGSHHSSHHSNQNSSSNSSTSSSLNAKQAAYNASLRGAYSFISSLLHHHRVYKHLTDHTKKTISKKGVICWILVFFVIAFISFCFLI